MSQIDYSFKPIVLWPKDRPLRQAQLRKRAAFDVGYTRLLELLDAELSHLKARSAIIQLALTRDDIRLDGRPRSGASPSHPGVILTVELPPEKKGEPAPPPMNLPCDQYKLWQANLRAIVLTLQYLRKVDDHGVTQFREQYKGFQALPPPGGGLVTPPMSVEAAAAFVCRFSGAVPEIVVSSADNYRSAYREAAKALHPDRGGDAGEWAKLGQAKAVLDRQHGL